MIRFTTQDLPSYAECPHWKHFEHEDKESEDPLPTQEHTELGDTLMLQEE